MNEQWFSGVARDDFVFEISSACCFLVRQLSSVDTSFVRMLLHPSCNALCIDSTSIISLALTTLTTRDLPELQTVE